MKTLKDNEVYMGAFGTFLDVVETAPYFIEEIYNKKRLHSALDYLSPEEFERKIEMASQTTTSAGQSLRHIVSN